MDEISTKYSEIILIDDNHIDQLLHKKIIELNSPNIPFVQFTNPREALLYIKNKDSNDSPKLILLDIKMPEMDGFQFLEQFHLFDQMSKQDYNIYILTSSLNQYDISKSRSNPYVKDMIIKPLNKDTLLNLLAQK